MQFSVVIPTYNNLPELQRCLKALGQVRGVDFEVLICVDGSTDGTLEWLNAEEMIFPLTVLHHPGNANQGRSATRNLALSRLRGQYTLFLDSDMEANPDLFERHLDVLKQGASVSIGPVYYRNAASNLWVRYTSERGVAKYAAGAEVPFQYFITPNTALPTTWWKSLGGFDPEINRYGGEDMELGYRIHREFRPKFIYNAAARVFTTQPKTLREALPQLKEYGQTGLPYIVRKWPELNKIYWVDKVNGGGIKAGILNFFTRKFWRPLIFGLLKALPYGLQKYLVSYLVISFVHEGFRAAKA